MKPMHHNRRRMRREPIDLDPRMIDYKNVKLLKKVTSNYAKILPGDRTGVTSKHQRKLAQAIKRARTMALLPYTRY